jgi:hypothetical protein
MVRPERSVIIVKYSDFGESFPASCFFLEFVRKNHPHIRVLAGFLMFYVLKQGTTFASVPGPLAGFWRGVNLPYFDNQSVIIPPFPHEQKRTVLRAYPEPGWILFRETEPNLGLFSPGIHTLIFQISSTKDT